MQDLEIPLTGGNSNAGVVRAGETVRRSKGPSSDARRCLLNHLHSNGFDMCPVHLGEDAQGREMLSYVHGHCGIHENYWKSDAYILSAATMLRSYHDATVSLLAQDNMLWGYSYPDISRHEVICHNDFAPYNLISDNEEFTAVIDFDLIGPGPRLRDVAYAAYWLTPISQRADEMKYHALADVANGNRRLKLFCDTYGVSADESLLDMISEVLHHMSDESEMLNCAGKEVTKRLKAEGHLEHWLGEATAFDAYRHDL